MGSIKAYWQRWLWRDAATRIITVNTIAWIVIAGGAFLLPRDKGAQEWWLGLFGMPSSVFQLPARIWTVGTYMVSQYDFLHLLVNMLWLLLFGKVIEYFVGPGHVVGSYVIGGLAGAGAYLLASMAVGRGGLLLGASCSVLGVVGVALAYAPKVRVNLLLFGEVKLLWVCMAGVALFVVTAPTLTSSIAHGAGLLAGVAYGLWLRRSQDIDMLQRPKPWQQRPQPRSPRREPAPAPAPRLDASKAEAQPNREPAPSPRRGSQPIPASQHEIEREIDALLDKVNKSGYASLSPAEKQRLFDLSQRLRR